MTVTDIPADTPAPAATPAPSAGRRSLGQYLAAVRLLIALTVVLGLLYPLAVLAVAQLPGLRSRADGSPLAGGDLAKAGSSLIAQPFTDAKGNPLPQWFQPRPSAAGAGWDPKASGASNLGPSNPKLITAINDRRAAVAAFDSVAGHPVAAKDVPADAVTTSASGLDPDISPAYARLQVYKVAAARNLDPETVFALVAEHVSGRELGFLGERKVNVLELNRALASMDG